MSEERGLATSCDASLRRLFWYLEAHEICQLAMAADNAFRKRVYGTLNDLYCVWRLEIAD